VDVRSPKHAGGNGKGLPGLAQRAAAIGGRCVVSNASPGTRVRLILPVVRPEAAEHTESAAASST
jgi:signal transduction histidine kinase